MARHISHGILSAYFMNTFEPLPQSMRKHIRTLHKKAQRDSEQLFILEGEKLLREALSAGLDIVAIVVHPESSASAVSLAHTCSEHELAVYQTPQQHFQSLCDTTSPQGIVSVAVQPANSIDYSSPLVVLDGVADPGNVGTIIRTADWFGYRNVLLGPGCADRFNPKTLRSTMGSAFRVAVEHSPSIAHTLHTHFSGGAVYGAALNASTLLAEIRPAEQHALVLGSETHGISADVLPLLSSTFLIPGGGHAESLNVAVAAGVSLYHFSSAQRAR